MHLEQLAGALQKFGFTKPQAKIYLSGLILKHALMMPLARTAGVRRSTAYYLMKELLRRGFFTSKKIGKRNYYVAASPKKLLEMTKEREKLVRRLQYELGKLSKI